MVQLVQLVVKLAQLIVQPVEVQLAEEVLTQAVVGSG